MSSIDTDASRDPERSGEGAGATAARARRIVILVGSLGTGGAERVAATMANAWAAQGRSVWLVSTYLNGQGGGYPLHAQVATIFLSDRMRRRGGPRWLAAPWKVIALRELVRHINPDVVVSFLTNVNVLAIAALALSELPLIVSERTDPAADIELPRIVRCARAVLYRYADALVVQTAAAARRYALSLPRVACFEVIHNPLSGELDANPLRARHDSDGGVVVGMGRLSVEKGFGRLIEAYGKALGDDPSWTLQIWGDGPLRGDLSQLIDRLGLSGRAQLCGVTKRPWDVLAAAQIFALTSDYEGFPNAMLEAMAVGLPCVAFDCPSGPRELADGGSAARIVPPGDMEGLARALHDLAADRESRRALGARAAVLVRQRFAEARIMSDWDRLIDRLLPRAPVAGPICRTT